MDHGRRRHPTAEWLSRYRMIAVEIEAKQEQLRQLPRVPMLSDTVAETERLLLEGIDILAFEQLKIRRVIAGVENCDWRNVLEFRYINGWSWGRIAEKMNYERTSVWRIHKKAINSIRLPESCNTMQHSDVVT